MDGHTHSADILIILTHVRFGDVEIVHVWRFSPPAVSLVEGSQTDQYHITINN